MLRFDDEADIVPEEDEECASPAQFSEALDGLGQADIKRLDQIAGFWWKAFKLKDRSGSSGELLQEAVLRTLEGRRHWPNKRVQLVKYLDQTMRSIASHRVEAAVSEERGIEKLHAAVEHESRPSEGTSTGAVSLTSSALTELVADEQWREVEALFADHPRALEVFQLKVDGWVGCL